MPNRKCSLFIIYTISLVSNVNIIEKLHNVSLHHTSAAPFTDFFTFHKEQQIN